MSSEQVHEDLHYVRAAVEASSQSPTPPSIYLLWALIGGIGLPMIDWAPQRVAVFWLVAAPAGFAISLLLGRRRALQSGQQSRGTAKHALHWGSLLLAPVLAMALPATGRIEGLAAAQVVLLLIATVYYLAGVHLDRALLWVSGWVALGYLSLFVLDSWGWTVVGLTLALALATCAWLSWRRLSGRGRATA